MYHAGHLTPPAQVLQYMAACFCAHDRPLRGHTRLAVAGGRAVPLLVVAQGGGGEQHTLVVLAVLAVGMDPRAVLLDAGCLQWEAGHVCANMASGC